MGTRPGDRIADELAGLRQVAVLVAGGARPEEIFAAVTAEIRRLLDADMTSMLRYDPDAMMTTVARWSVRGDYGGAGVRTPTGGRNVWSSVLETGRPARMDDYRQASGPIADFARRVGIRCSVGVPINVDGRLWGVIVVSSLRAQPWPADTETWLAGFTELVGTAIASAQARLDLRGYAEEQAALRRVATLVASGAPPQAVFTAVASEAGRLLAADLTAIARYEPGEIVTTVGAWSGAGITLPSGVGTKTRLGGHNMGTLVFQTGKPARIDDYRQATGAVAGVGREWGFRLAVGAPITVEGRLWGIMTVASTRQEPFPADTEARLAGFAELAGTAIANAEAQAALAASRARIVAAADEARRQIERDLHDGAQQRLVSLALQLRDLQAAPPEADELARRLDGAVAGLEAALEELREIASGIHPALLAERGLRPALQSLARRCPIPVNLHVNVAGRMPDAVEIAAYYVVGEALTNTAKHADASTAEVTVAADESVLRVCVRDNGRGGADLGHSSGLLGLNDRVETLGGIMELHSPPAEGTTLEVHIPLATPVPG